MNESKFTPTPHIEAKYGDFAETVIMPGDPLRASHISENFLINAKLINSVRGMYAYTGESIRVRRFQLWQVVWVCPQWEFILMNFIISMVLRI